MILKCSTWYQKIIENADIWVNESDCESANDCCQCMAVQWLCACVSEFSIIIFNEILIKTLKYRLASIIIIIVNVIIIIINLI